MFETIAQYLIDSGFGQFHWSNMVMILVGLLFIFLAIRKGFEPLLLVPIGFGILIGNIPYDASKVAVSVYDGPVSERYIVYHELDIEKIEFGRRGHERWTHTMPEIEVDPGLDGHDRRVAERRQRIAALQEAYRALQQRLHPGDDAHRHRDTAEPWNHAKLMRLIYHSRRVHLREAPPAIESHLQGMDLVERGLAVMVNRYSTLTARHEVSPPAIELYGGGRYIMVDEQAGDDRYHEVWSVRKQDPHGASVFWWLFTGVGVAAIFPPLIFLGIGALTDFGPMLANPKTLLLGAAAQFGIFGSLFGAILLGFSAAEAASIGIIGGADGPTAIFLTAQLAPELLGPVALAAYSYMAMVPLIQPPIIKLLTTERERMIQMQQLKPVSKRVKVMFPIVGFLLTAFLCPAGLPLLGMLFFGNLLKECMVTDRLAKTAQTSLIDIVTILLGVTVGAKTSAANFLTVQTIGIFLLGILAFALATAAGVLFGKLMNAMTREPINPMIGAAGVSAVPMAARVVHRMGQEADRNNFLIMHAMGPNVAGVIGSAVAAGVLLSKLAGS